MDDDELRAQVLQVAQKTAVSRQEFRRHGGELKMTLATMVTTSWDRGRRELMQALIPTGVRVWRPSRCCL
jgi:hypothetical protein